MQLLMSEATKRDILAMRALNFSCTVCLRSVLASRCQSQHQIGNVCVKEGKRQRKRECTHFTCVSMNMGMCINTTTFGKLSSCIGRGKIC
jgi:hypothetical protein